jgi:hypothetical protein
MSHYSPAQRFDQQDIARPVAARIETELAEALRDAGLLVQGGH